MTKVVFVNNVHKFSSNKMGSEIPHLLNYFEIEDIVKNKGKGQSMSLGTCDVSGFYETEGYEILENHYSKFDAFLVDVLCCRETIKIINKRKYKNERDYLFVYGTIREVIAKYNILKYLTHAPAYERYFFNNTMEFLYTNLKPYKELYFYEDSLTDEEEILIDLKLGGLAAIPININALNKDVFKSELMKIIN